MHAQVVPFFCDQREIISHYTGCKINPRHSKLEGLSLEAVWCFVNSKLELLNAHDSLVDARAQADVLFDNRMNIYRDKVFQLLLLKKYGLQKGRKIVLYLKKSDGNLLWDGQKHFKNGFLVLQILIRVP